MPNYNFYDINEQAWVTVNMPEDLKESYLKENSHLSETLKTIKPKKTVKKKGKKK